MHRNKVIRLVTRALVLLILLIVLVIFVAEGLLGAEPVYAHRFSQGEAILGLLLTLTCAGLALGLFKPRIGGLLALVSCMLFLLTDVMLSLSNAALFSTGQWFIYLMLAVSMLLVLSPQGPDPERPVRPVRPRRSATERTST